MSDQYVCPKCGYRMALAPLKNVTVVHPRTEGARHRYRINKGRR